ncbi:MAG TPA: hypothetical protein VGP26_17670 [Actinophytocola sp.]|nr:hypothetical protein [Actinophytocola sp.]
MRQGLPIFRVALIVVGMVLCAAGPGPLLNAGRWLVVHTGVALLAVAAGTALWAAVPRESRALPLALAAAGVVIWSLQQGVAGSSIVGGVLIGLGAFTTVRGSRGVFRDDVDPVHTYRRMGGGRSIKAGRGAELPRLLRLRAIGAPYVRVDLTAATPVRNDWLEIALTCWFSEIEVVLPDGWAAVAGRVGASRRVRFCGQLDSAIVFDDVGEQRESLLRVAAVRSPERPFAVVFHVAGAVSTVRLARG